MMNFISKNMTGNKYHNLILLLGMFTFLLLGILAMNNVDLLTVDALRSCAGCAAGL